MNAGTIWGLLKQTFDDWNEDKAPRLAAALAYYTLFSLAPLLVIVIAIAGLVFGQEAAAGQVSEQIRGLVGDEGGAAIETMIAGAGRPGAGIAASVIGLVTLLLGAAGLFGALQDSLNTIWEVQPKPNQGIGATIRQRFFSFTMVLGTGFLLLVSLVVSTALATLGGYFQGLLPGFDWLWSVVNIVVGLVVTTVVFALIFKVVPDVEIAWGDVWIGAGVTALLFTLGRFALAQYLGRATFGSTYGTAASLIVVLLWVYYTAQILFFGAEFTQVYARRFGSRIRPSPNAEPVTEEARAQQGMPRERAVGEPHEPAPQPAAAQPGAPPQVAGAPRSGALATIVGFVVGTVLGQRRRR